MVAPLSGGMGYGGAHSTKTPGPIEQVLTGRLLIQVAASPKLGRGATRF